jgi:hypothetical protein
MRQMFDKKSISSVQLYEMYWHKWFDRYGYVTHEKKFPNDGLLWGLVIEDMYQQTCFFPFYNSEKHYRSWHINCLGV